MPHPRRCCDSPSEVVETLADRLEADVEPADLEVDLAPRLRVVGTGLVIRHRARRDVPPLIWVDRFTVDADLLGLWREQVSHVTLEGLEIQVPPSEENVEAEEPPERAGPHPIGGRQIVIGTLEAPDARVIILRREKNKPPRTWHLHELRVKSVSANTTMSFEATVTNAVPPGTIETSGTFGPWHRADPGHTPLDGSFLLKEADLSTFKGIAGRLSADSGFRGSLEKIDIHGETDTPDFTVTVGGHPVRLTTSYHAVVDATNGNTTLERIDATFMDTSLVAKGGVYEIEGVKGRAVKLDITMDRARLEDVMRLAINTPKPPMRGASASSLAVAAAQVGSDFLGHFRLRAAKLFLPTLVFDIPGAAVQLSGWYALRRETLAFRGNLIMDAKVSQTVTGWKSWLLRIADPFFRRNGRTVVPIKIMGTRDKPSFGIEPGRSAASS